MFENLIEILKANPRKIVYTEGTDARILASADRLKKGGFLTPVLVGNVEAVKAAAEKGGFDIEGLEILDPATYERMDEMVDTMVALRKGKMTPEECGRRAARRSHLLDGRHRPSRAAARQDPQGRQPRELLLHPGQGRRADAVHGRLRDQHRL